jgi:hypothetical protein
MFLHYLKEFDNDFTGWSNQDLSFTSLFGIVLILDKQREGGYDVVETIIQHGDTSHVCDGYGFCSYKCEIQPSRVSFAYLLIFGTKEGFKKPFS